MTNLTNKTERVIYLLSLVSLCLNAMRGNLTMTIASGVIVLSLGMLLISKSTPRITINNNYK